jgi:hypothetical protein
VWRGDQFLEMMRSQQRLALPHHRPQIEVKCKFLVEPLHHSLGDQPLGPHIRGRRDEHPQGSSLGFRHRLVSSARSNSNVTVFAGRALSPEISATLASPRCSAAELLLRLDGSRVLRVLRQCQPLGQQLAALGDKALVEKTGFRDTIDPEITEVVPQLAPRSEQGDVDVIGHRDWTNRPVRVMAVLVDLSNGHFARVVDRSA